MHSTWQNLRTARENVGYVKHRVPEIFPCREWQARPGLCGGELRKITLVCGFVSLLPSPQGRIRVGIDAKEEQGIDRRWQDTVTWAMCRRVCLTTASRPAGCISTTSVTSCHRIGINASVFCRFWWREHSVYTQSTHINSLHILFM